MNTALITGGASGIGFATVELLSSQGWHCVIADIREPRLGLPEKARFIHCDVSDEGQVQSLFRTLRDECHPLDVVVTAAAVHSAKGVESTSSAEYVRLANVNMYGVFLTTREALPILAKTKGSVVTIGSDTSLIPDKDAILYTASKNWIVGYTKALSLKAIEQGVRVNCICPGQTDTPFLRDIFGNDPAGIAACAAVNPLKRLARPSEIAEVILAVIRSSFANGAIWNVDGGYSWQSQQEPPKAGA
jgi:NAD(P)-dependent dehydrogenase (short-subunit alcohol dehydrogenase family)